ncbi:MAG: class I SAM-dependent methyltransferase [Planctomycetia bacterium]|nr:class I SAM-dependent methyltransferase [Planctomycetia bacterium]
MTALSKLSLLLRRFRRRIRPKAYKEYYIQEALDSLGRRVYLEIGVRLGDSFRYIKSREKIGVDPCRTKPMLKLRSGELFFEMTSDDFFRGPGVQLFATKKVDVCLVDGLHSFGQALADVLNAAKVLRSDGVIVLDDVYPDTPDKASPTAHGRAWNGDVWKTMALLRFAQPDWEVYSLPADEGVGIIKTHGCAARAIAAEDVARYGNLPYEALASDPAIIGLTR